jgi:hypothetical protein
MHISRFTAYERLATSGLAAPAKPASPVPPPNAMRPPVAGAQDEGTIVGDVPPAPTPEARAMVDRASERIQEMVKQNRELHFTRDPNSHRVVIEVRDLEGNVLKTIPPAKALDILSGAEL